MNLFELQQWLAGLIASEPSAVTHGLVVYNPANSAAGTGVVIDDGNYPNLPGREAALSGKGVCFVIAEAEGKSIEDSSRKGSAWMRVGIRVAIEENITLNRSEAGTRISLDQWIEKIWKQVLGKSPYSTLEQSPPTWGLEPDGNAFTKLGTEGGTRRCILDFSIRYHIGPNA